MNNINQSQMMNGIAINKSERSNIKINFTNINTDSRKRSSTSFENEEANSEIKISLVLSDQDINLLEEQSEFFKVLFENIKSGDEIDLHEDNIFISMQLLINLKSKTNVFLNVTKNYLYMGKLCSKWMLDEYINKFRLNRNRIISEITSVSIKSVSIKGDKMIQNNIDTPDGIYEFKNGQLISENKSILFANNCVNIQFHNIIFAICELKSLGDMENDKFYKARRQTYSNCFENNIYVKVARKIVNEDDVNLFWDVIELMWSHEEHKLHSPIKNNEELISLLLFNRPLMSDSRIVQLLSSKDWKKICNKI
jgi:hypothetical protein